MEHLTRVDYGLEITAIKRRGHPYGRPLQVGMARFELATSWSQTRRDNRATLHPELKNI